MKHLLVKRSVAVIIAAFAITLIMAVPMAWGLGLTPGGNTNINQDAILGVAQDEAENAADQTASEIEYLISQAPSFGYLPNAAAAQQAAEDAAAAIQYGLEAGLADISVAPIIEPYPDPQPVIDTEGEEIYVDNIRSLIPNKAGVKYGKALDGVDKIANGALDGVTILGTYVDEETGDAVAAVVQFTEDGVTYVGVIYDSTGNLAEVITDAVKAIEEGTWDNVRIETCVTVDNNGSDVVAISVGPIGGAPSSNPNAAQCPNGIASDMAMPSLLP